MINLFVKSICKTVIHYMHMKVCMVGNYTKKQFKNILYPLVFFSGNLRNG